MWICWLQPLRSRGMQGFRYLFRNVKQKNFFETRCLRVTFNAIHVPFHLKNNVLRMVVGLQSLSNRNMGIWGTFSKRQELVERKFYYTRFVLNWGRTSDLRRPSPLVITRQRLQWMLHERRVNASTARELFPSTLPLTLSTGGLRSPSLLLASWTTGYFRSECWTSGESMAALRVNCFPAPKH